MHPPDKPAADDPDSRMLAPRRRRLRQILLIAIATFALLGVMNIVRARPLFLLFDVTFTLFFLVIWWRNKYDAPARTVARLLIVLLIGLAFVIPADQGLFDEGLLAFPAMLLLGGMFGSRRFVFGLTLVMMGFIGLLYALHLTGTLPSEALPVSSARPIIIIIIIGIVGFFVGLLMNDLRETMRKLDAEKRALLESNKRIEVLTQRDSLTGLPNRRLARDHLERLLGRTRRSGERIAVMFLDIDNFKTINDSLGHAAGDALLCQVAARLDTATGGAGLVARISGDEFVILLGTLTEDEQVTRGVARVMDALKPPFSLAGLEVTVTGSLGITIAPQDSEMPETLLKNADLAMYRAKDAGRNTFRFFDPSMNASAAEQLRLASELHGALARNEMQLHYQPEIDLASGRVVGAEALLRWQHPELGAVAPETFIPVAERTGLINALGQWVLRQACLDARAWATHGLGPLSVAVNISATQFRHSDMAADLNAALAASALPPDQLVLELTESSLIDDPHRLNKMLHGLTASGVRIAIDDFGTGYSNLSCLRHLAVHRLKIDQSFVQRLSADGHDAGLVRAIVEMGHWLGLEVVAEGVEDAATMRLLRSLGCESAQGFHWSRPIPMAEFIAFVHARTALPADG